MVYLDINKVFINFDINTLSHHYSKPSISAVLTALEIFINEYIAYMNNGMQAIRATDNFKQMNTTIPRAPFLDISRYSGIFIAEKYRHPKG